MAYTFPVLEILKSATFDSGFPVFKDRQARARNAARIDRLAIGNPGDVKPVGSGVSEIRIDYTAPAIECISCGVERLSS